MTLYLKLKTSKIIPIAMVENGSEVAFDTHLLPGVGNERDTVVCWHHRSLVRTTGVCPTQAGRFHMSERCLSVDRQA